MFKYGFTIGIWFTLASGVAHADLIAYWSFNDNNLVVDQGAGSLVTNVPASNQSYLAGTTLNAPAGVVAGNGLVLQNQINNGRFLDFHVDTSNFEQIKMTFATQRTATGFSSNQFGISSDAGATFQNIGSPHNPPTTYGLVTFDLSANTAINQNPNAILRITLNGATSSTGNTRIDNVQIMGAGAPMSTAVPEPSSAVLGGLAMLVVTLGRLRMAVGSFASKLISNSRTLLSTVLGGCGVNPLPVSVDLLSRARWPLADAGTVRDGIPTVRIL